ncbi:MAG: protein translocase subunit SecD [Epsilonproteobacteria bacterium]|nr:protein translocase subunit SecD [Campylobacterota bacterium]
MNLLNYRLVIFTLVAIFGIVFSIPSFIQSSEGKKITLGLDLQGGIYMLLGVETEKAVETKIKSIAAAVQYYADQNDILIDGLTINPNDLSFIVLDESEIKNIDTMLATIQGLEITKKDTLEYKISLTPLETQITKDLSVAQAVETIRNRLDQFGLAEPSVTRQGTTDIVVELPGIKTEAEEQRARELIAKPANLELMSVDETLADQAMTMSEEEAKATGHLLLSDVANPNQKYIVKQIPILTGAELIDARVAFDSQGGSPIINFELSAFGGKVFGDYTAKNVGTRLAVVLDGKVFSAPVIRERIGGGSGQISGGFSVEEAGNVAIALRSGALPAPVIVLEKRSVGPSLGAESIQASLIALISGFIAVVIFMMVYYRRAGIVANIALIVNIFIIIAVMAMFGATLTLPGMAGIVLTVGMAVDANVIINERIRDLLAQGMSIPKAIENGYKNAMSAILDSNITTLLVAVILYAYGTGPIKGFAVTISIGILASMITAILGTHGIYNSMMRNISIDNNKKKWFGVN